MKLIIKLCPWAFLALFLCEIIAVTMPRKDGALHVQAFGSLPVLLAGRVQPFDSVARNSLLQIRSTSDVPLEEVPSWKFWHHPKKLKASEWLLELMTRPEQADQRPVFLIHHSDLLSELKLENRGVEKSGLRYYTFDDLRPLVQAIGKQGEKAETVKEELRNTYQKQVLKLANAVMLYHRLKFTLEPEGAKHWAQTLADFRANLPAARAAAAASQNGQEYDKSVLEKLMEPLQEFQMMASYAHPLVIPPEATQTNRDAWQSMGTSLLEDARAPSFKPATLLFATMADAYQEGNASAFNQAISDYQSWLKDNYAKALKKGAAEFYFNRIQGFLHATIIYIFALVLGFLGLLLVASSPPWSEALRRSSFYLILLAGVVHTFTLIFRMVLQGRPPVTNLYSSAIFIGWGVMVLGLILERIYRIGIGNIVASFAGFMTLLIAHNLAMDGDTMEMMRAVLDTNFWLATHVVVVTLGYASTFVCGLLAILYITLGFFTPLLKHPLRGAVPAQKEKTKRPAASAATSPLDLGKGLGKMVYGIVCFATLFSFVGTVLGGIWADQSWGRFWGWDPKENGALLIVIWNALILHARWGGLVRERGIMLLAVFGNVITSFSWFGVNMLGIGLHSYGFMDAAFKWLIFFICTQVAIIALGALPLRFWKSFRSPSAGPGSPELRDSLPLPARG